jgi:hypothetical protein
MNKIDLKKEYSQLYKCGNNKTMIVTVPELQYLMCDGHGDPNNSEIFQQAIEALYGLSYTLKFMIKKGPLQVDYGVMPLEGIWWADDMNDFLLNDRNKWKWTLMILQPDLVTPSLVEEARKQLSLKKEVPMLQNVRLEKMAEGTCAQILHIGPYSAEGPTIEKLHNFIADEGYKLHGTHREIYLSDMRRTAQEKLKTIIRQPIKK